ncbi:MAG TPA: hypothetical protein VFA32_01485, partial [Dehalococcoidia bacterium]|nr:hypothetical protein [Dehalococcoidia bacterium]
GFLKIITRQVSVLIPRNCLRSYAFEYDLPSENHGVPVQDYPQLRKSYVIALLPEAVAETPHNERYL